MKFLSSKETSFDVSYSECNKTVTISQLKLFMYTKGTYLHFLITNRPIYVLQK